jgi:hypothetical protein
MLDYELIIRFQNFICLLIYLLEKLIFKYILNNDIIIKLFNIKNYDKIHSMSILYLIFNIQIYTFKYLKNRIIKIYYNNEKISDVLIEKEINKNNKNKIVLKFIYLDQYNFINHLEIYNCGVIYHHTNMFTHTYNYLGNRREEKCLIAP